MKPIDANRLLRAVFWARLSVAGVLLPLGSLLPDEMMPGTNHAVLAVSLATVALSSVALLLSLPTLWFAASLWWPTSRRFLELLPAARCARLMQTYYWGLVSRGGSRRALPPPTDAAPRCGASRPSGRSRTCCRRPSMSSGASKCDGGTMARCNGG